MPTVRRRTLAAAVWIPLRVSEYTDQQGKYGHVGYREQFCGIGTLAVPLARRSEAEGLDWTSLGTNSHGGLVEGDVYVPCDIRVDVSGLYLALERRGNSIEHAEWHLHQDLVITLGLKREDDVWVSLTEGYATIARLIRDQAHGPSRLEVRASHLRDYLCARQMALRVVSYRRRTEVVGTPEHITWAGGGASAETENDRWKGQVVAIHEGGEVFGAEWHVVQVARTDVDPEDDVPVLSHPAETTSRSWTRKNPGGRLYRIDGEVWRKEWIEPAERSERVRGDEGPATAFFTVDAEGRKESRDTLREDGRWLWFRPDVILSLVERRGGGLKWHTRDTGSVSCSPGDSVHFGINSLGLINVYAKDIAYLPDWQQTIWAGFNVGPDGKVSDELCASQVKAEPAATVAPEAVLGKALARLERTAAARLGITIIRHHPRTSELLERAHRFRATSRHGLCALAKDLFRLTGERIDARSIQTLLRAPMGAKREGSLKSLENLLATRIEAEAAATLMSPLFGIYELRLADAHLPPRHEEEAALQKVGISSAEPFVIQGQQLMHACVSVVFRICKVLDGGRWDEPQSGDHSAIHGEPPSTST